MAYSLSRERVVGGGNRLDHAGRAGLVWAKLPSVDAVNNKSHASHYSFPFAMTFLLECYI